MFYKQWDKLRDYVHSLGIEIIGDLPIYVALTPRTSGGPEELSAGREEHTQPAFPACRPTSARTAALGQPHLRLGAHEGRSARLVDTAHRGREEALRRHQDRPLPGFESYWSRPIRREKTAKNGKWMPGRAWALWACCATGSMTRSL